MPEELTVEDFKLSICNCTERAGYTSWGHVWTVKNEGDPSLTIGRFGIVRYDKGLRVLRVTPIEYQNGNEKHNTLEVEDPTCGTIYLALMENPQGTSVVYRRKSGKLSGKFWNTICVITPQLEIMRAMGLQNSDIMTDMNGLTIVWRK